jgi:hypothetical protein
MQDCEVLEWEHRVEYDENHNHKWDCIRITVASMIVSNAASVTSTTRPVGGNDTYRLHHSQAFHGTVDGTGGQGGFLATDNLVRISEILSRPRGDLVIWVNNASEDTDLISDEFFPPQQKKLRQSPRRIILAACGWGSKNDYDNPSTEEGDYVNIQDPAQKTDDQVKTSILRRDVLDCDSGPKPISVVPIPIAGGKSFRLVFTIEVCRTFSIGYSAPESDPEKTGDENVAKGVTFDTRKKLPVIYNRWSVVDSEDDQGRVTHTISGRLIVQDKRYKANAMRLMAFPLAFPFARLASRRYATSEDGKTLSYEFSFTHAGAAPPQGVRDYKATYLEGFSPDARGLMKGAMSVQVSGWYHRSTDDPAITVSEKTQKAILLRQAYSIVYARIRGVVHKLQVIPGQEPSNVTLLDLQVIEQVGRPELEIRVEVMYGGASINDTHIRLQNMGENFYQGASVAVPSYSPLWWPIDNEFGRLTNIDDEHPDYLYPPIGNTDAWKPYDDYFNNPDVAVALRAHNAPKTNSITGKPKKLKREIGQNKIIANGDMSGSRPEDTGSFETVEYPDTQNPINQPVFSAVVSVLLNGAVIPAATPPQSLSSTGIWDANQIAGFASYVTYEAETLSDSETGKLAMPLSKPRRLLGGNVSSGGSEGIKPQETSTTIRLFAGSGKRVINVKGERLGAWPIMPTPAEEIQRTDDSISGAIASVEQLIQKRVIHDNPQPLTSGNQIVYTTNMQLVYSCSRPWSPNNKQAGYQASEIFPLAINKMLKHDQASSAATKPKASETFATDVFV